MKNEKKRIRILRWLGNYMTFFFLVAFVITCCMLLFISILSATVEIELTRQTIKTAAKLTFFNVLLISLIFATIDSIRRKLTVERPVKQITRAADKMMKGDFSVTIPRVNGLVADESFNQIIDCFNNMAKELAGVETLRSDFIASVSHEMKTPLSVMQNYGTLLQTPNLPEEKRLEYAKSITEASKRMAEMMTNILKLNRLENQQIFPKTAEFDLTDQLCRCLLQFENLWEDKGIDIETELEDDVTVKADEELLFLVWNNLLSNAFKFTEKGGTVKVKLSSTENHATVEISDTGCGMTAEVGSRIFEKFYQGDTSRTTEGNGLGLALVKRVIDIMQGEITVQSSLGVGSVFTVRIRRKQQ